MPVVPTALVVASRLVTEKLPAPLVVSSVPSARASALTVAVFPVIAEMVVAPVPVVMATSSTALMVIAPVAVAALRSATRSLTVIAPLPARVMLSAPSKVPLVTVKEPDAALLVMVVLKAPAPSLPSRVSATVPVALLLRSPSRLLIV